MTAVVLCSQTTRSYLINYARSLIYTTAMGYPSLAAIQTVYDYLQDGKAEGPLAALADLTLEAHRLLSSLCERLGPSHDLFRVHPPESPILPLFTNRARSLARHCQDRGYMVRPIVAPTVPKGTDRVRLCLHAANTVDEVRGLCAAVEEWLRMHMDGTQPSVLETSKL